MAHCSSMPKWQSPCNTLSRKWDIHKLAPPYKRKIQLPTHYSPTKIMPKALKAMDMQFHWLHCRKAQDQYCYYWRPRTQKLTDYWTKHHPASHHKAFWPQILTSSTSKPATEVFPSSYGNFHPLTTLKNTATKSFVKKILSTPAFVEQLTAQQQTIAAKGA